MNTLGIVAFIALSILSVSTAWAQSDCAPLGMTRPTLEESRAVGFATIDDGRIAEFLSAVPTCLSSLDPFYRDLIAYEGTATLLRREGEGSAALGDALRSLRASLIALLDDSAADPDGVTKPFAALVLAEVVRTDRVSPWMSLREREDTVTVASAYLSGVRDYRAFEDGVGFRHGVAHGADLALQLALNTAVPAADLAPLVVAIGAQVSPAEGVAYSTGEPERLVRALFYLMQRAEEAPPLREAIQTLLDALQDPAPYPEWGIVFQSERGLVFRHNRRSFLIALYLWVQPHATREAIAPFMGALETALDAVP